jgi:iron complex outermembrane receptor protein
MPHTPWKLTALAVAVHFVLSPVQASAQTGEEEQLLEEVVTIGTRSQKPRSASDSPVPVDVISGDDFNALGNTADITDNLKAAVPSYTATPATGDGSAFVRPTSLRGTAPDQTLVLINGKRRHRSALVQFFAPAAGNGAHGPDIGMIPGIALKRVEVLRDGAAAQYGSDAIAGVINFVTKDASEGGEVSLQYGQHYEGEQNIKFAGNVGLPLGNDGYVNLSLEANDNEGLSRGVQRPDAQALIDAGVTGVGQDTPFEDAPLAQSWGRPEFSGTRFYMSSGLPLSDTAQLYARLGYAETEGRYRFFYRTGINPNDPTTGHSTLRAIRDAGFTGNLLNTGYTPYLDGDQKDLSLVVGIDGEFGTDWYYDVSASYGKNELDYFLNNSLNPDLALMNGQPKRDFDVGGYEQEEVNLNADFSKQLSDTINLGFGFEYRDETFTAVMGEPDSFAGGGVSGFRGITQNGDFSRDNYAAYADIEHEWTDALLMQYALRYEDFSDFGSTINGKLAGRYRLNDAIVLRAAVSTGFHAPTPGQANVTTIITTFDGTTGQQVEEGLVAPDSAAAASVGGAPLKEEESFNISAGFTADLNDFTTLTFDLYKIEVDDRIYRTGDITTPGGQAISFYTNALDVEHQGVEIVLTSTLEWSSGADTALSFAFSHKTIEVVDQATIVTPAGLAVTPVSDSTVEDIENNYPENTFVLSANTHFGEGFNFMVRANYYGEHYDERGTINAATNPSAEIDAVVYLDMELGWDVNDNVRVVLGASNIFDEYIDEIDAPFANRQSVGLQYPRRTAANYEGGSWYLRGSYRF